MKIAAICATPRGRNTGMRCVDRALELLIDQAGLGGDVDYYCFDLPNDTGDLPDAVPYRPLAAFPGHDAYQAVILWGDFLLSDIWIEQMVRNVSRRENRPENEVRAKVYDTLFPPSEAQAAKMLVFGSSLQLGNDDIFRNDFYLTRVRRLLTAARFARVRDPISAYRCGLISGLSPAKFMGVDAALLLNLLSPASARADVDNRQVGIFLGRTDGAAISHAALAYALRRTGSLQCSWLPWIPRMSPSAWTQKIFGIQGSLIDAHNPAVADYIAAVRGCRLVVTDAYHLTLMAWSNGVPAICIGKGAQHFEKSTYDKKKEVFYNSNYLNHYYFFSERWASYLRHGAYRKGVERALDSDFPKLIQARLEVMAAENLTALRTALDQV